MQARYVTQVFFTSFYLFAAINCFGSPFQNRSYGQPKLVCLNNNPGYNPENSWSDSTQNKSGLVAKVSILRRSLSDLSPAEQRQQAIIAARYDAHCKKEYHLSAQEKIKLMSAWRYKTFTKKLLEYTHLEDAIVLRLWDEFKQSKHLHGDDEQKCEQIIYAEFKKRQAQREKQQKLLTPSTATLQEPAPQSELKKSQDLPTLYNHCIRLQTQADILQQRLKERGIDSAQSIYLPQDFEQVQQEYAKCADLFETMMQNEQTSEHDSDLWNNRFQALDQTNDQNFSQSWQQCSLLPQTQAYLNAIGLNPEWYTSCYGTALQHQIHSEICSNLESIANQQHAFAEQSHFLKMAAQCSDASFDANDFEAVCMTIVLNDLAIACCNTGKWALQRVPVYAQKMKEGVVESAHDFVHMIGHPQDVIVGLASAAYVVAETLLLHDPEPFFDLPEQSDLLRAQRHEQITAIVDAGLLHLANADGPERAKMFTKFSSDCFFQHKALQVVGTLFGVLSTQVTTAQNFEFAMDLLSYESEFATAAETVGQATHDLGSVNQF